MERETGSQPPPPTGPPVAPDQSPLRTLLATNRPTVVRWILGSAGLLVIGSIGTWATASVLGITATASGLHGGGWVTLVAAIGSVILVLNPSWLEQAAWVRARRYGVALGLGVVAVVICILNISNVESSGLSGIVHPGWGLYLALVSSLSLSLWTYVLRTQERRPDVSARSAAT